MTDLLITNGTIVTDSSTFPADLLVHEGRVAAIGAGLQAPGAQVIDAAGLLLLPGGVDVHTHFDLPMFGTVSSDDHYTGTKAAAFGGTTTVLDFVSQDHPTLQASFEAWRLKASRAAVDYSCHMNLTRFDARIAAEIPSLPALGVTSLKVFTAYNGRLRLDDAGIFQALRLARRHGLLVMAHCEDGDVIETLVAEALAAGHTSPEWHARTRPAWGAAGAALRMCSLAAQAGAPLYIVHMNTAGEVDMLAYARDRGVSVMGETCPQYLFFSEEDLRRPDGARWICSPPLRTRLDQDRLWQGLQDGTIQVIGTDHCPFFFDGTKPIRYEGSEVAIPGKELGCGDFTRIPNGLPGVGDRLPILWTAGVRYGRLSASRFVALTSANPARIFGLYPRKGALLPGSDADIVLWDPQQSLTYGVAHSHHRTDYNLYEGWQLVGMPSKVFLRGSLVVDGQAWLGKPGQGEFLPRTPFAPLL